MTSTEVNNVWAGREWLLVVSLLSRVNEKLAPRWMMIAKSCPVLLNVLLTVYSCMDNSIILVEGSSRIGQVVVFALFWYVEVVSSSHHHPSTRWRVGVQGWSIESPMIGVYS